jgi:hypothetical protein
MLERGKSPKEGTGDPHSITLVSEIMPLSRRLISVVSVVNIGILYSNLEVGFTEQFIHHNPIF